MSTKFLKNPFNWIDIVSLIFSVTGLILACVSLPYVGLGLGAIGLAGGILGRIFVKKHGINEWYARIVLTVIAFLFFATLVMVGVSIVMDYIGGKQLDDPMS